MCEGHTSSVTSVVVSNEGDRVVAGSNGGSVRMWSVDGNSSKSFGPGHRSKVTVLKMHPYSHYFASGSTDTNIKVWDIGKRKSSQNYKKHMNEVTALEFSPDGKWLVSGDKTGRIYIWNIDKGRFHKMLKGHLSGITSFFFHPTHMFLASASHDKTAIIWDVDRLKHVAQTKIATTKITNVVILEKSSTTGEKAEEVVFCAALDSIKMWKWKPLDCVDVIDAKFSSGLLDFALDEPKPGKDISGMVAVSRCNNLLRIWNINFEFLVPFYDMPRRNFTYLDRLSTPTFSPTLVPDNEDDLKTHVFDMKKVATSSSENPTGFPTRKVKKKKITRTKSSGGEFYQGFLENGWKMCSILNERYNNYVLFRNLWFIDEHTRNEMLKQMVKNSDDSLVMLVMENIFNSEASMRLITVEMCNILLKIHLRLMKSTYEGCLATSIKNVRVITKKFLPQILVNAQNFEVKELEQSGKECKKYYKKIKALLKTLARDTVYGDEINSHSQYLWSKLSKIRF